MAVNAKPAPRYSKAVVCLSLNRACFCEEMAEDGCTVTDVTICESKMVSLKSAFCQNWGLGSQESCIEPPICPSEVNCTTSEPNHAQEGKHFGKGTLPFIGEGCPPFIGVVIIELVGLMDAYLEKIKPQVSNTWRADELWLKVKGNTKWLFSLMDDETRYWIAQQISDHKGTGDIRPLLKEARIIAGKRPETFITDGANNFHEAYVKEFYSNKNPVTLHVREIALDGERHNNKMERMNGEFRDRERVMRSLKKQDTPILKGYQIFHNFIRTHEGLDGKTPAEASGIKVEGANKWVTIIQNATKEKNQVPRLDTEK